jgi:hypothetical protein
VTSTIRALVVATFVVFAVSPAAMADSNLVVYSNGDCPSGKSVTEALQAIRPDQEWAGLSVTLHIIDERAEVTLGEDQNNRREVSLPADCTDRANRIALVIAVWSRELPEKPTSAPSLSVAVPAPAPISAKPSAFITQLGLSGFYSMVGGVVPGVQGEVGRLRREGWWGVRVVAAYQSAKSLRVDIGISQYDRTLMGAFLALQWNGARVFVSSDLGLVGAFTRARGDGYSQNQSAKGLNAGGAWDGRAGLRLGTLRVWADLLLYRWTIKETVRVDSLSTAPSSASTLPTWDAHLGLGAGVVFD